MHPRLFGNNSWPQYYGKKYSRSEHPAVAAPHDRQKQGIAAGPETKHPAAATHAPAVHFKNLFK
jgi:hypothetical protein